MSDSLKSILFAGALCVVCSLLLTAASSGLKEYQQSNIVLDRQKNLLKSVGLIVTGKQYADDDIRTLYEKNITRMCLDEDGKVLASLPESGNAMQMYVYATADGTIMSYILPINSRGLWGRILGYLAIDSDGTTINGFTVYKHSETPGLGGEIESAWFQKQFKGKKIVDQAGEFVSISVAKGTAKDSVSQNRQINYVDGISGATLTGKFLSGGIRETLSAYEPISIKFRTKQMKKKTGADSQCVVKPGTKT